jgi:hypothetical protein
MGRLNSCKLVSDLSKCITLSSDYECWCKFLLKSVNLKIFIASLFYWSLLIKFSCGQQHRSPACVFGILLTFVFHGYIYLLLCLLWRGAFNLNKFSFCYVYLFVYLFFSFLWILISCSNHLFIYLILKLLSHLLITYTPLHKVYSELCKARLSVPLQKLRNPVLVYLSS